MWDEVRATHLSLCPCGGELALLALFAEAGNILREVDGGPFGGEEVRKCGRSGHVEASELLRIALSKLPEGAGRHYSGGRHGFEGLRGDSCFESVRTWATEMDTKEKEEEESIGRAG